MLTFFMRIIFICIIIMFAGALKAQTALPGYIRHDKASNTFTPDSTVSNNSPRKKWFVNSYNSITAGYSFFRGGRTSFMAAPLGLQLYRRINNNVYAFAGVIAAPTYLSFNHAFLTTDANKLSPFNSFYQPGNFSMYSAATLGLMYINNARTFSVSGSISVEKNNYPSFYNNQFNATTQNNTLFFSK